MADEEETPAPYVHNDDMSRDSVSSLLQSWGLPELKAKFKSHHVEARALACLTEKDICELIPKIGRRAIFRSSLMEWRRQNKKRGFIHVRPLPARRRDSKTDDNIPIPHVVIKDEGKDTDDESADLSENTDQHNAGSLVEELRSEDVPQERPQSVPLAARRYSVVLPRKKSKDCPVDVNEILSNSYEGQQIIAYYEVNGSFDYSHRRRLVTLLINDVIRKNQWLVQDDFAKISNDIIQLFPREDVSTYYTARNGAKNPKGCLYNKFLNLTRKLRQEGILQYRNNVLMMPERTSARHSGEIKCYRESS